MEDKFVNGLKQIEYKGKVREFERIRNEALKLCCDVWYDIINVNVESVSDEEYEAILSRIERIVENMEEEFEEFNFDVISHDYDKRITIIGYETHRLGGLLRCDIDWEAQLCLDALNEFIELKEILDIDDLLKKINSGYSLTKEDENNIDNYYKILQDIDYLSKIKQIVESINKHNNEMSKIIKDRIARVIKY